MLHLCPWACQRKQQRLFFLEVDGFMASFSFSLNIFLSCTFVFSHIFCVAQISPLILLVQNPPFIHNHTHFVPQQCGGDLHIHTFLLPLLSASLSIPFWSEWAVLTVIAWYLFWCALKGSAKWHSVNVNTQFLYYAVPPMETSVSRHVPSVCPFP